MGTEFIFIILAFILLGIGFLGTFVPGLPGAPLAWAGLLLAHFTEASAISIPVLVITGFFTVVVTVLDMILPSMLTKKSGGSKAGSWGCTIGIVIGVLSGPWGILIFPFLGALVGEIIHDSSDMEKALTAAFGAFKGFLLGTGLKMIVVSSFIFIYIMTLVK